MSSCSYKLNNADKLNKNLNFFKNFSNKQTESEIFRNIQCNDFPGDDSYGQPEWGLPLCC